MLYISKHILSPIICDAYAEVNHCTSNRFLITQKIQDMIWSIYA